MKRLLFYATPADIHAALAALEVLVPVEYAICGAADSPLPTKFSSHEKISGLGTADSEQTSGCTSYLVYTPGQRLVPMAFAQEDGRRLFSYTQMENEDTVVFRPAGLWGEDICIYGEVSTIHESPMSQMLMKNFRKQFAAQFSKVKSFWLGPEARQMLHAGKRLTMAVQSPLEYNLSSES